MVLSFGATAEGRDQQKAGAIEDGDAGDIGIPAVIADEKAATAIRRVDGAAVLAKAIEPPRAVAALGELHFVILSTQMAAGIDEDGAVVDISTHAFGAAKGEIDAEFAGQQTKASNHGPTHGDGDVVHPLGGYLTGDDFVDDVPFDDAFGGQRQLGATGGGLPEGLFEAITIVVDGKLFGDKRDCRYIEGSKHSSGCLRVLVLRTGHDHYIRQQYDDMSIRRISGG